MKFEHDAVAIYPDWNNDRKTSDTEIVHRMTQKSSELFGDAQK